MRLLTDPIVSSPFLSLANAMFGTTPSVPTLSDDEHMNRARIAEVLAECEAWLTVAQTANGPFVGLPPEQMAVLLSLAIAQLKCRDASIAIADAITPADSQTAVDRRDTEAKNIRVSVDRLMDVNANSRAAIHAQRLQRMFAPIFASRAGKPHA